MDHADPAETLQPGLDQVGVDLLLTRYMFPAASDPCTGESSTLTSCHKKGCSVVVFWCLRNNTTMAENDEKRNSVAAALQNSSSTGTTARVGAGKRRRHAKRLPARLQTAATLQTTTASAATRLASGAGRIYASSFLQSLNP